MWSLGCVIYYLSTQKVPFLRPPDVRRFCQGVSPFPEELLLPIMSENGISFLKRLLIPEPEFRLSSDSALRDVWIMTSSSPNKCQNESTGSRAALGTFSKLSILVAESIGDIKSSHDSNLHGLTMPERFVNISHQDKPDAWDTSIQYPSTQRIPDPNPLASSSFGSETKLDGTTQVQASVSRPLNSKDLTAELANSVSQIPTPYPPLKLKIALYSNKLPPLEGHSGDVCAVAFSPGGRLVASTSKDRTIKLWDSKTGMMRKTLKGHSGYVYGIAFSPDGELVASAWGDRTVMLWDLKEGTVRQILEGHGSGVFGVAFSPDGALVASASGDHTVRLWDSMTGIVRQTLNGHSKLVFDVAFSPDGELVASASWDRTVMLWDWKTGTIRYTLKGHNNHVYGVAFSPDSELVASASWDGTIRLWHSRTGTVKQTLKGHIKLVHHVAFSPNGELVASASEDQTVRLWDSSTGTQRQTLTGHTKPVYGVAFSPNGELVASASKDRTVRLWDSETGKVRDTLDKVGDNSSSQDSDPHSPTKEERLPTKSPLDIQHQILLNVSNSNLQPLSIHSETKPYKSSNTLVQTSTYKPPNSIVSAAGSAKSVSTAPTPLSFSKPRILLYAERLPKLEGHGAYVNSVAFSPNGQLLASASDDGTVRQWDSETGMVRQTLRNNFLYTSIVVFSPDGQLLASASGRASGRLSAGGGMVRLWDSATGTVRQTLEGHGQSVSSVAFSPDGQLLASASEDGTIRIWDSGTGTVRRRLIRYGKPLTSLAFSPDSQLLASGSEDGTVRLWESETGTVRWTLKENGQSVTSVAFSPNGQLLALASGDGTVRLVYWETGDLQKTLTGHTKSVYGVAFSPDGQLVASASGDRTIRLWDLETGTGVQTLKGHGRAVLSVAFSPDGQLLASASEDRTVRLWNSGPGTGQETLGTGIPPAKGTVGKYLGWLINVGKDTTSSG
jgi:WD40 repeat protein